MRIPLSALIGLVLTGMFLLSAIFAPLIAPYPIDAAVGGVWESPSSTYWLGTDTIGRDILSRLIYGGQITIFVAAASSALAFGLGSFFGFLAATQGGWVDQGLSRLVDLMMAIPSLIIALVVLSVLPAEPDGADPGDGRAGCDPRLPPVARGRHGHHRDGLRRGRKAAR